MEATIHVCIVEAKCGNWLIYKKLIVAIVKKKIELNNMTDISSNITHIIQKMNLTKLSKTALLEKCEELGIKKCKSKNKDKLIELINTITVKKNENHIKTINNVIIENDEEEFIIVPKKKKDNLKSINVIDLFCGCGGMSKGL